MTTPPMDSAEAAIDVTPEMIAAAWRVFDREPHKRLGPGPAFAEAIRAALALAGLPRCSCPALVEALEKISGGFINSNFVMSDPPDWHSAFSQLQEIARAALAAQHNADQPQQLKRVKHKKRGTFYHILGPGTLQTDKPLDDNAPLVIYRSEVGGRLRARAEAEFYDGRYENADEAAQRRDMR